MKVFNIFVENYVEKALPRIKNPHHYGAYSCLHKFWCRIFSAEDPFFKAARKLISRKD
jgi:hypothetical protein